MSRNRIILIAVLILLLTFFAQVILAQDPPPAEVSPEVVLSPEPVEVTEQATVPVEVTEEAELTPELLPPSVTPIPTEEVPAEYMESFDAFDASRWVLNGFAVTQDALANSVLSATSENASAETTLPLWANFSYSLMYQIETNNTVSLLLYSNDSLTYEIMLGANGGFRVYLDGNLLHSDASLLETDWHQISLRTYGPVLALSVDTLYDFSHLYVGMAPIDRVVIVSGAANEGRVAIDNVQLTEQVDSLPLPDPIIPTEVPTLAPTVAPTLAPTEAAEVTPEVTEAVEITPEVEVTEAVEITPEVELTEEAEITPEVELTEEAEITPEVELTEEAEITPEVELTEEAEITPDVELTEEPELTPEPEAGFDMAAALSDPDTGSRMVGAIYELAQSFVANDTDTYTRLLNEYGIESDAAGRLRVDIWTNTPEDLAAVLNQAVALDGTIEDQYYQNAMLYISLEALVELATDPAIFSINIPSVAASTGSSASGALNSNQMGSYDLYTFDVISAHDWHKQSIYGSGVNVHIIDAGFAGINASGDRACLKSGFVYFNGANSPGTSNHGLNVIEVICDIAPLANVYVSRASDAASLTSALNQALTGGPHPVADVVVVTLDLGVHQSAGDGFTTYGGSNFYAKINDLKNAGIPVIVSAGNNRNRMVSVTSSTTIPIQIDKPGTFYVNVGYDWSGGSASVSGMGISATTNLPKGTQYTGSCASAPCTGNLSVTVSGTSLARVQLVGDSAWITSPGTVGNADANAGQIGTPGDSATAITVGAICPQEYNLQLMKDSSSGPVFGTNGSTPGAHPANPTRNAVKPDLVGPSTVATSLLTGVPYGFDCSGGEPVPGAFNGTSAASAHVAGMTALMLSNTANSSMNARFNTNSASGVAAIKDYLQSHTTDLWCGTDFGDSIRCDTVSAGGVPDGFDNVYGAGLVTLGNPNFNLLTIQNLGVATDGVSAVTALYVGQANLDSTQDGSPANPYTSIEEAINNASPGDRVVVYPGEYVSPIILTKAVSLESFDYADIIPRNPSVMWVVLSAIGNNNRGGMWIYQVNDATYPVGISGFEFYSSDPELSYIYGTSPITDPPLPIFVEESSNVIVQDNKFYNFHRPMEVVGGGSALAQPVQVINNLFKNFSIPLAGLTQVPEYRDGVALNIFDTTAYLKSNRFEGNTTGEYKTNNDNSTNTRHPTDVQVPPELQPIVLIRRSRVDMDGAYFQNNVAEAMVSINQLTNYALPPAKVTAPVKIFSSVFDSNTVFGPLIHLWGEDFTFTNNTVANLDTKNNGVLGSVIALGWPNSSQPGEFASHRLSFFNNLLYNVELAPSGTSLYTSIAAVAADSVTCLRPGGSEDATGNNWIIKANSRLFTAPCGDSGGFSDGANNNWVTTSEDADDGFIAEVFLTPLLDPSHPWRLRPQVEEPLPEPPNPYNGINDGADSKVVTPLVGSATDVLGMPRKIDPFTTGAPPYYVDVGAYEAPPFSPPTVSEDLNIVGIEDSETILIDLRTKVEGGIQPYFFTITEWPANYNANPLSTCGGKPYVLDQLNDRLVYCPPTDFYTDGSPNTETKFKYMVTDVIALDTALGNINITITPTADPMAAEFGNAANPQRIITDLGTQINYKLRPYVSFKNFTKSDPGGSDYPFTYSFNRIVPASELGNPANYNAQLFGASTTSLITSAINTGGGIMTLNPVPGQLGYLEIEYTATDALGGQSGVGRVRITVVERLAGIGIHDDFNLLFDYVGSTWQPIYHPNALNKNYHATYTPNDFFEFRFTGDTFYINMLGATTTAPFEVLIDPDGDDGSQGFSSPAALGLSCNKQPPLQGLNVYACSGLESVSGGVYASEAHILKVTNKALVNTWFYVDSIQVGGASLEPGHYEEVSLINYSGAWTFGLSASAVGGNYGLTTDINASVSFKISPNVSRLQVTYLSHPSYQNIDVYIDDVFYQTITNDTFVLWQTKRLVDLGVSNSVRKVTLKPKGVPIIFEAIDLYGPPVELGLGSYNQDVEGVTYSGKWATVASAAVPGGNLTYTTYTNDQVIIHTNSDVKRIEVKHLGGAPYGGFDVYIDGVFTQSMTNLGVPNWNATTMVPMPPDPKVGTPKGHIVEFRNNDLKPLYLVGFNLLGAKVPLAPGYYEEYNPEVIYKGKWTEYVNAGVKGGTGRLTTEVGSSMKFTIADGIDRLVLHHTKGSAWGNLNIFVDGGFVGTIPNTPGGTALRQSSIIVLPNAGSIREVEIRNSQSYAIIEAFELLAQKGPLGPALYNSDFIDFTYTGNWLNVYSTAYMLGEGKYTTEANAALNFAVDDDITLIKIYYTSTAAYANASIKVDGNPVKDIIQQGATTFRASVLIPITPVALTFPNISIVKDNNSKAFTIEAIELFTAQTPLPVGSYNPNNPNMVFGGSWIDWVNPLTKYGFAKYGSRNDNVVRFKVDASVDRMVIYRLDGTTFGAVDIYVNGGLEHSMPDNVVTTQYSRPYLVDLPGDGHVRTVEIRNRVAGKNFFLEGIDLLGTSSALAPGLYNDNHPELTYSGSGWSELLNASTRLGSVHATQTNGDKLQFDIADNVAFLKLIWTTGSAFGDVKVTVTGSSPITLTNPAGTTAYQVGTLVSLGTGTGRTVEIEKLNGTWSWIEAIELLGDITPLAPGIYNQDANNLLYAGVWTQLNHASALNGNMVVTTRSGDSLTFKVDATAKRLAIYHLSGAPFASFDTYVDGVKVHSLLTPAGTATFNTPTVVELPGSGVVRTVEIRSTANAALYIEQLTVLADATPLAAGEYNYNNTNIYQKGSWAPIFTASAKFGNYIYSTSANNSLIFPVDDLVGRLTVRWLSGTGYGDADVYINGVLQGTLTNTPGAVVYGVRASIELPPGVNRVVEIRSKDTNKLAIESIELYAPASVLSVGQFNEDNLNVTYTGNWIPLNNAVFHNGTLLYSARSGDSFTFNIDGAPAFLKLHYRFGTLQGKVDVYVDNALHYAMPETVGTDRWGATVTIPLPNVGSARKIEVKVSGTKTFFLEGFDLLAPTNPLGIGEYQEYNPDIVYIGPHWTPISLWVYRGGSSMYTNVQNENMQFKVADNVKRLVVWHTVSAGHGDFTVNVSGAGDVQTVINPNTTTLYNEPVTITLPAGTNRLVTINNDQAKVLNIEAIQLLGDPAPLAIGQYQQDHPDMTYNGAWTKSYNAVYKGGKSNSNSISGDNVQFAIADTVQRVVVYLSDGAAYGPVELRVNGVLHTTFTPGAVTSFGKAFVANIGTGVGRTIELRNASNKLINIEAIDLLGAPAPLGIGSYNNDDINFNFTGTWVPQTMATAYQGNRVYTNVLGSTVNFQIDATVGRVVIYYTAGAGYGPVEIRVDGGSPVILPDPQGTGGYKATYVLEVTPGIHTIELRSASTQVFALEGIELKAPRSALSQGVYSETDPNIDWYAYWINYANVGMTSGTSRYSPDVDAKVRFTTAADVSNVIIHHSYGTSLGGPFDVKVDGSVVFTYPGTVGDIIWTIASKIPVASGTTHVVEIVSKDSRNINIQQIELLGDVNLLGPGYYEQNNPFMTYTGTWNTYINSVYSGLSMALTTVPNNKVEFDINGTGVIVYVDAHTVGATDVEICIDADTGTPADGNHIDECFHHNVKTTVFSPKYGLSLYGLPSDSYHITVTHKGLAGSWLAMDAIAVLDTAAAPMTGGTTYDFNGSVLSGPGSPADVKTVGAWYHGSHASFMGGTYDFTLNYGNTAYFKATGNIMTLYRLIQTVGSPNTRVCLSGSSTSEIKLDCSEYSSRSNTLFQAPIILYGMGPGTHNIFVENRAHGQYMRLDAIKIDN